MAEPSGCAPVIALGIVGLLLYQCTRPAETSSSASLSLPTLGITEVDEDEARDRARDDLDGTTYQETYGALGCTFDCGGHDAGFEWAQAQGIEDASECGGNSPSFIEGCEAYAEALEQRAQEIQDDAGDE